MLRCSLLIIVVLLLQQVPCSYARRVTERYIDVAEEALELHLDNTMEEEGRRLAESGGLKASRRTAAPASPEDHRVVNLPGLSASISGSTKQYAGFLQVDAERDGNIFYWLIEKPKDADKAPLVIWMNGGPGCTSMDGLFLELGPFRLDGAKVDQLKLNPYSWHNAANMLFIDQPVGTGYSYTSRSDGYAKNDATINTHITEFLEKFFTLHERYTSTDPATGARKSRPLFFTGESHAGHYIPNMMAHLLERNAALPKNGLSIDLRGAALGNPWIDPYHQYDASELAHGLGFITKGQLNSLREADARCKNLLKNGKLNQHVCFELLDHVIDAASASGGHRLLMYDARKFVSRPGSFPPGHTDMEAYMNRADVRAALHATSSSKQRFQECADPPYLALQHQDGLGATPALVTVLDKGVQVLIFTGQFDLVCNHLGVEALLAALPWTGQADWQKAETSVWVVDRSPAGYVKVARNLQALVVLDSGHMVPMDQPARALDMFTKFLSATPIGAHTSSLKVSSKTPPAEGCVGGTDHRRTSAVGGQTLTALFADEKLKSQQQLFAALYVSAAMLLFMSLLYMLHRRRTLKVQNPQS